jgi:photosystem II stability/assembly factor-like uncharacterized protein
MKSFVFLLFLIFGLTTFFANAQNATFDWIETELSAGNTLEKMTISGDEAVIIGSSNTLLKSIDNGTTWDSINIFPANFYLRDISIYNKTGYIVAGKALIYSASLPVYANGFILKTTNNGNSWNVIENPVFGTNDDPSTNPYATLSFYRDFQAIETINDTIAYCALRWSEYNLTETIKHQGVFKTVDGGENWKNISGDLQKSYITTIEFYGNTGFIGGKEKLYKTTTNIDTLTNIFEKLTASGGREYINDIDITSENNLYIITSRDSIYYSTDSGASFNKFKGIKGGNDILKINDSTLIVAGGSSRSFISVNNGQNWSRLNIPTSIWEIGGVVKDSLLMLAKAGIYKAAVAELVKGNLNFIKQPLGSANIQRLLVTTGDTIIVIGNNNCFHKSINAGISWSREILPEIKELNEMYENLDFSDLDNLENQSYTTISRHKLIDYPESSGKNDIYWSGDLMYSGDNWKTFKSINTLNIGKTDTDDPTKNPNHNLCNGLDPTGLELMDNGSILLSVRWFDYSTTPERSTHTRIFKSTDKGKNWAAITDDFGKLTAKAIDSKGDTIYIGGNNVLLKSEDGGNSFTNLYPVIDKNEDDKMFFNSIHIENFNEVFLVTYSDSIFRTTNGGVTFNVIAKVKGAYDFYKFDNNSWIFMGSTGKSKFTNSAGNVWQNCNPGAIIFETGGVYGDKFYALARGAIYTTAVNDLNLKTSVKEIKLDNELTVCYKPFSIEVVSLKNEIERCKVYSITGRLISDYKPNNRSYELQRSNFQPGIYIIDATINGRRHSKKIVF